MSHLPVSNSHEYLKNLDGNINQLFKWSRLLPFNVSNDNLFFDTLSDSGTCQKYAEFFKFTRQSNGSFVVLTPL